MGGKKKPKVEIVGMGPDISALAFNQLVAIGRHQIAKREPVMNQLFHSDGSIQSATTLSRQDTHSTRSTESDDESDIDTFLDYAQSVIAEKSLDYDSVSLRRFDSELSRSIRSHFRDIEDDDDSLNSSSSYSGYSADEMTSFQSVTHSLAASETSSCRQNGRVIARKKTWAELTGNRTKGQDEVSIKTEDAWDNVERTVDDLAFALAIENHKGGLLSHQLSPGKTRRVSPSKHDSPHRHDTEVKKFISKDDDSELTQSTALQDLKIIAGAQDDRHAMSQGASPSRSHDGREPVFEAPSPPAPDAQDEPPSVEEDVASEHTVRTAPHKSFQNRLRTGHENEDEWLVGNDNLFYSRSSPTQSLDASKYTTSLIDEESGRLGRKDTLSPNAKTILDIDDTGIIDSRLCIRPASYDDDSARYLTEESFDRQISLSIDDSAEHSVLPDLSVSESLYESVVRSTSSDEMLSVSFDDAAPEFMSIDDDAIDQMSVAFSSISVDSGSQNIISRHVDFGISEDPHHVITGWDLDEMVENFLTGKIERLTKNLKAEKELQEKGQALNGTHDHANKPEDMISSQPLNTNLSKSSNETMQWDGRYTSEHLEPSLNDVSGESDFAVFPRKLDEPTACLSVEMPVQRIQQKLSFDEELQLKGRDLIRRIREKRKARMVSDLKGRVFDPSDDPTDRVKVSKDSPPSPWKSKLTLSSPESHSNERSQMVDSSDGLMDFVQRPKDSLSSPRKSGLMLSHESQSSERSRSNFSEVKTDNHHENELVSFLTRQNHAPRSPPVSKPRRNKSKKKSIVLDMTRLSSPKNKTVDERYEDRQEEYQPSKRTSSAAPEITLIKDRTRYNDDDKLKRSRLDSRHEFESSIPCPLKYPTKKFGVNISCVDDDSSPPPVLRSTPDYGSRPRSKNKSFLASELCSGYPHLSPPSPESPIGEFSMRMVEEASEQNYELCDNSIVCTGSSNNGKKGLGKVPSSHSQSLEFFHQIKAKDSSYDAPVANFKDAFDDILLRRRAKKSDLKQGQRLSPSSVFDCFEPATDFVLQQTSSEVLFDHISSGSLAFVDDQEGDRLFLDDDEDMCWASNSIAGSDKSLPVNSLVESEYCPPGVGKKAYREYGMLSPNRFEI